MVWHNFAIHAILITPLFCSRRSVLESDQPARANGQIPPALARRGGFLGVNGRPNGDRGRENEPAHAQLPIANGRAENVQVLNGQQVQYPVYRPIIGHVGQQLPPVVQPQRLRGFFGPDGVWHPWPHYPEAPAQVDPRQGISAGSGDADQASAQSLENAVSGPENTSIGESGNRQLPTSSSAREAAAAAALRRFNPSSSPNNQAPTPTTNALRDSRNIEATPTTQSGSAPQSENATIRAPVLIPLFDLDTHEQAFYGAGRMNGFANGRPIAPQSNLPDIQTLPQQLSAEQMGRLDRLTRDALDERLRILENVQTTTERCIEELLKCRSMFPRDPREPLPQNYYPSGSPVQSISRDAGSGNEGTPGERREEGQQAAHLAG